MRGAVGTDGEQPPALVEPKGKPQEFKLPTSLVKASGIQSQQQETTPTLEVMRMCF